MASETSDDEAIGCLFWAALIMLSIGAIATLGLGYGSLVVGAVLMLAMSLAVVAVSRKKRRNAAKT